jgi:aspartate kinase
MAQQLSIQNITTFTEGNPFVCKIFYQSIIKRNKRSKGVALEPYLPCIVKRNQLLISLSSIDFSFIMEENISEIFALFHEFKQGKLDTEYRN